MLYAVLTTDTQSTLKYHLVTVKPSSSVKTMDCMHQTEPTRRKLERLDMSPTCSTITMSIMVSVAVSKMGIFIHQTNRQYCRDILLSQQIYDSIKCVTDGNLSFRKMAHWCSLHSTQSNCCGAKHSSSLPSGLWPQNGPELNCIDYKILEATQ